LPGAAAIQRGTVRTARRSNCDGQVLDARLHHGFGVVWVVLRALGVPGWKSRHKSFNTVMTVCTRDSSYEKNTTDSVTST